MRGGVAQMDPPAAELDEHQDIQCSEPGGLDGEEVTGDDPARQLPEELGPARASAPWGRTEPGGPEQGPDRRRADADPELAELALDPHAAPARVLPVQPADKHTDRGIDRWPSRAPAPTVGPLPPHALLSSTSSPVASSVSS